MRQTIKKGSRGEDVKTVQRALHLFADGIFGVLTDEAVKEFQKSQGLTADGIVGSKTWAALELLMSDTVALKKSKRIIKEIVVHCSDTWEGKDYTVAQIRGWHIKERGWSDIGYHYVIYRDGSVHNGRDIDISGAHCTNHNSKSIGVCYIGGKGSDGKPKDTRTDEQKKALEKLLSELREKYNLPHGCIYGHKDFAVRHCPCFDAREEYKNI